jgi:aminocarboxymuconate-semialdehyde decarboxylase
MSLVIDVHTHMMGEQWFELLREHGGPRYTMKDIGVLKDVIHMDGSAFTTPNKEMFDYDLRIKNMNKAKVDIAIVSLTCPNVFWGDAKISLKAAEIMNDDMAAAQRAFPDRIRYFASLPWQHPKLAVAELDRAVKLGAVGVMVLANIGGVSLTDPSFADVWKAIDDYGLPVLVHPTAPPGVGAMDMATHNIIPPVGFTFDTTLAITRCIYDGFLDRYTKLKLIASHGGGALPYLVGRLDRCFDNIPTCNAHVEPTCGSKERPSNYMRRIYVDAVVYRQDALEMCINVCGPDNVLYGSDYPHNIGDMTGCLSRVDSLPENTRHLVRGKNSERIFKL